MESSSDVGDSNNSAATFTAQLDAWNVKSVDPEARRRSAVAASAFDNALAWCFLLSLWFSSRVRLQLGRINHFHPSYSAGFEELEAKDQKNVEESFMKPRLLLFSFPFFTNRTRP